MNPSGESGTTAYIVTERVDLLLTSSSIAFELILILITTIR